MILNSCTASASATASATTSASAGTSHNSAGSSYASAAPSHGSAGHSRQSALDEVLQYACDEAIAARAKSATATAEVTVAGNEAATHLAAANRATAYPVKRLIDKRIADLERDLDRIVESRREHTEALQKHDRVEAHIRAELLILRDVI